MRLWWWVTTTQSKLGVYSVCMATIRNERGYQYVYVPPKSGFVESGVPVLPKWCKR